MEHVVYRGAPVHGVQGIIRFNKFMNLWLSDARYLSSTFTKDHYAVSYVLGQDARIVYTITDSEATVSLQSDNVFDISALELRVKLGVMLAQLVNWAVQEANVIVEERKALDCGELEKLTAYHAEHRADPLTPQERHELREQTKRMVMKSFPIEPF